MDVNQKANKFSTLLQDAIRNYEQKYNLSNMGIICSINGSNDIVFVMRCVTSNDQYKLEKLSKLISPLKTNAIKLLGFDIDNDSEEYIRKFILDCSLKLNISMTKVSLLFRINPSSNNLILAVVPSPDTNIKIYYDSLVNFIEIGGR